MSGLNKSNYTSPPQGWDDHAEEYHAMTISFRGDPALKQLLSTANKVHPFASATAILDDGCGSGHATYGLIEQYGSSLPSETRLIASDYSPGMIAKINDVKKENASNQWWQRLETHVLDAENLLAGGQNAPIKANTLSHIISNLTFMGITDYRAALKSAHEALAEGGVLALSSWLKIPWVDVWTHARSIAPDQEWNTRPDEVWASAESIKAELVSAGFKAVESEGSNIELVLDKEALRQTVAGFVKSKNPMSLSIWGKIPAAKAEEGIELIVNGVEKEYGGWPVTMTAEQVTVCGTK